MNKKNNQTNSTESTEEKTDILNYKGKKKFIIISPYVRGKKYQIGDSIELTAGEANPLLELEKPVIKLSDTSK